MQPDFAVGILEWEVKALAMSKNLFKKLEMENVQAWSLETDIYEIKHIQSRRNVMLKCIILAKKKKKGGTLSAEGQRIIC